MKFTRWEYWNRFKSTCISARLCTCMCKFSKYLLHLLTVIVRKPAPLSKYTVSAFQISCKLLSFTFNWNTFKKWAEDQCSSRTKGSIYYIKLHIQPFTTVVDWPEIYCVLVRQKHRSNKIIGSSKEYNAVRHFRKIPMK